MTTPSDRGPDQDGRKDEDATPSSTGDSRQTEHPTGEEQAETNRETESPS